MRKLVVFAFVVVIALIATVTLLLFKERKRAGITSISVAHACAKDYPMRELAGRKFGGHLAEMTGIRGTVPEIARLDFCANLGNLWALKQKRSRGNRVVAETGQQIVAEYHGGSAGNMTLENYADLIDEVVEQTHDDLNWQKVGEIERLDKRRLALVRKIAGSFTGVDFLAYSMTELMPTTDGRFNAQVYEFLVRNGGRRYVESIPAIYDGLTSFGPYQFTPYAWYEVNGQRRGGSKLNAALAKPVPHNSVMRLREDEHHVAAFLFAVDNLAYLVRGLNAKQLTTLERVWKSRHDELVQFVATAHNYPYGGSGAEGAAKRWLANGCRKDYIVSCTWRPRGYAKKTAANLAALRKLL